MSVEAKLTLKVLKRLNLNGALAELRRARKGYKCSACGWPIERGEEHYCIYYGKGLAALKFPDRCHVHCINQYKGG